MLLLYTLKELHNALQFFITREGNGELSLARSGVAEGDFRGEDLG